MTDKPKNPSAFPSLHNIDGNWTREPLEKYQGMTLRDYFAGQAISNAYGVTPQEKAQVAYEIADAMLKEKEKTNDR